MDTSAGLIGSSLEALSTRYRVLTHNLANANTAGFKKRRSMALYGSSFSKLLFNTFPLVGRTFWFMDATGICRMCWHRGQVIVSSMDLSYFHGNQ